MTSGVAWSTRPFRPETLQAAREAARRSGLSFAEWLNSAVLDTATNAGVCVGDNADETRLEAVTGHLQELADRMRRAKAAGSPPGTGSTQAVPELAGAIEYIEDGLRGILRDLVPQSHLATHRLAKALADLNSHLGRLGIAGSQGEPTDPKLSLEPRAGKPSPVDADENRPEPNAAAANTANRPHESDAQVSPDFSRLEQHLRHMTEQIEALRPRRSAPPPDDVERSSFHRIESRIAELAAKLDNCDARLARLGAIERCLADVRLELKESRAAAREEADRAAKVLAIELRAEHSAAARAIDALEQQFTEFRASQGEIDHRSESTLEAIHATLKRLVERLATVDITARASAGAESTVSSMAVAAPGKAQRAPPPASAAGPAPTWDRVSQASTPSDLPVDYPLEPGSGTPTARGSTAAPGRSGAQPDPKRADWDPTEAASKASFIAAARRAAQAAAAENAERVDTERFGRERGTAAGAGRGRPIMIAAAILLFGAGGVHLSLNGRWPGLLDPARTHLAHSGKISTALAKAAGPRRAGDRNGPARPADPDPLVPSTAAPSLPPATGSLVAPSASIPSPGQSIEVTGALPRSGATIDNSGSPAAQEAGRPRADLLPSTIGSAALRSAALAGNPAAEYEIGVRFSDGRGVPQNFEQAAFWLGRAADQGLAPAQYRLASLREKGQGVKKDLSEARRLYSAAAQQGNGKAMHNLAVLYAVGLDGAPDYKIAAEWFRKAADHGLADSQYNLGILCMRGLGVEQNLTEAYKWFALAGQQGDKDAGKKRDEVAARLDPESLAAARSAVQSWSAEPEPEKAIKVEPPGGDGDASSPPTPSAQNKPGRRPGNSGPV